MCLYVCECDVDCITFGATRYVWSGKSLEPEIEPGNESIVVQCFSPSNISEVNVHTLTSPFRSPLNVVIFSPIALIVSARRA